jgi:hypothetical protein
LLWVAGLLAFYTVFGFLVLPLIVKMVAAKQLAKLLDREVTIETVRLNPYTLSATVRGLLIKDKDGERFVSWDEFHANFQLASFFGKPWVFKEIRLVQPFARAQINKDGSRNFSDLTHKFSQPADQTAPPSAKASKPPVLHVGSLQIADLRVSLTDLTPITPFHRIVGPLGIALTDFHTDPTGKNPCSLSGTTDAGSKYSWSGNLFLDPLRSEGEFSLKGLAIPKYAPLYQDLVRFEIKDGVVDFRSTYRLNISSSNRIVAVSNAALSLKSVKVSDKGAEENLVELDELAVRGVAADVMARTAEVEAVTVSGGRLALKREREGTLNLAEAARPAEGGTNAPAGVLFLLRAATNAFSALLRSTNLWTATLHEFSVTNCALSWEDEANRRPVRLPVDDITVVARHLSNIPGSNTTVDVWFRWNTNGVVRVQSSAQISPPAADVTLALQELELRPLDPYLDPFLNLSLTDSKFGIDGRIQMRMGTNELPEFAFRGDTRLNDFATIDSLALEDLVKWKSLQISGIDATLSPPVVTVKELAIVEPYARVVVQTNRLLNLLVALKLDRTNAPAPEAKTTEAPTTPAPRKKSGLGQKFGTMLRGILAANTNAVGSPLAPKLALDALVISNAHVQFNDRSLQPPVTASIQELSGRIAGLSSEEMKRADLHLNGKVGRTGPFELTGKIKPLSKDAPTELKLALHDVDLSPASPYAGKYVGYRLSRGKLNLDVNYEVSERKVKATNVIVLDQFTLGQKVESPDATSLPVRLAVAVLKDRNGKIELDVPIEGNLDEPQFRFGKAIMRVIANVITKIATSPFSMLGALFGGKGEEVSFQDFAAGSADLQEANLKKLDVLVNGLQERPGLQLEIEGSFDPVADREALRRQKLEREFRRQKWTSLRQSEQAKLTPEQVTLTPGEWNDYLLKAYAALPQTTTPTNAAAPKTAPASPPRAPGAARPADASERGATTLLQGIKSAPPAAPPNEIEAAVLQGIEVSDDDLRQLAHNRAQRVQQKILEGEKIESERILLADLSGNASTNRATRVYLHLR